MRFVGPTLISFHQSLPATELMSTLLRRASLKALQGAPRRRLLSTQPGQTDAELKSYFEETFIHLRELRRQSDRIEKWLELTGALSLGTWVMCLFGLSKRA